MSSRRRGGSSKKKRRRKKKKNEDPRRCRNLYRAAVEGNFPVMDYMFAEPTVAKVIDVKGKAGLAIAKAAGAGNVPSIAYLQQKGCSINYGKGQPLLAAAKNRQYRALAYLLDEGADANSKQAFTEFTALHYSAMVGAPVMCAYLLLRGAKINAITHPDNCGLYNGWTPLHFAANEGYTITVKLLCDSGADVDAKTSDGDTALGLAVEKGRWDVVVRLVEAGANLTVTRRGFTPFQWAYYRCVPPVCQYLVAQGALPDLSAKPLWLNVDRRLVSLSSESKAPDIADMNQEIKSGFIAQMLEDAAAHAGQDAGGNSNNDGDNGSTNNTVFGRKSRSKMLMVEDGGPLLNLGQVIKQETSYPVQEALDLALYRGQKQYRVRSAMLRIVMDVKWEVEPIIDMFSAALDGSVAAPEPEIHSFTPAVARLICNYAREEPLLSSEFSELPGRLPSRRFDAELLSVEEEKKTTPSKGAESKEEVGDEVDSQGHTRGASSMSDHPSSRGSHRPSSSEAPSLVGSSGGSISHAASPSVSFAGDV